MDGGAWWATVHGVAKSRTRLHFHFHSLATQEATSKNKIVRCTMDIYIRHVQKKSDAGQA